MDEFFQSAPQLKNQYDDDVLLQNYLKRVLSPSMFKAVEADLKNLGQRVVEDILALGEQAESEPPEHIPYDAWGKRIDVIKVSEAWKKLAQIAAEENLIGLAYERKDGALSRIYQFAKIYLFGPSSAIFTCPLAMSDGAARAIELYGNDELKKKAFRHLTSPDPKNAWTSGQWMTERTGGSDVSGTSTTARLENGVYKLFGTKWFTSATTSEMAITLARIEGSESGSRGLSLFYLELRTANGALNNIRINRLKEKLGTRALPTAELTLEGAVATLVGEHGNGVKKISSLFNITRIWNSITAVSIMRRGLALAKDYANKRKAFGKLLIEQPLHVETLAHLQVEYEGSFYLTFKLVELLGKEETGQSSEDESALLRLLTPVTKLFTAKMAIAVSSEILECFGGAGYVEDTGLPKLLRDSQVLSIWEGTTNVLSLDALRAIEKENVMPAFFRDVERRLALITHLELRPYVERVKSATHIVQKHLQSCSNLNRETVEAQARELSFSIARIYTASLLLEQAQWDLTNKSGSHSARVAAKWCAKTLTELGTHGHGNWADSAELLKV